MKQSIACFQMVLIACFANAQAHRDVDVCVYGGTSAGVIAAYTAKMYGKSVLLVEPGGHLGGLSSGGLGYTDIGNKYAVTGLARDFYRRIGTHYGRLEQWIFEPHVAENLFNEYIDRAQVEVLNGYRIDSASLKQARITNIVAVRSESPSAATNIIVRAKVFIDCSYEGDLMAKAGVPYTVGRESNAQFGETYNGFQLRDKHQFPDGVDPYKVKGDPASGLLWGISNAPKREEGSGDRQVQAYNFRICLTKNPQNSIAIGRPENYDPTRYELLLRLLEVRPARDLSPLLKIDLMPNQKTDINNNGAFSTDMIGMNYDFPDGDHATRQRMIKEHELYIKGLLYFIGHDERVPAHLRNEMLSWGYPRDEYTDNGHWSRQLYVREARRMVGEYVMTQLNCEGRTTVNDGVGMAAYTMDSHNVQRIVVDGMVKNEGDVQVGGFPPYPISYRSLVPKAVNCVNLLVPVCLSATHIAYGSIRMEPVFMVLAQSCAVAAVMAIDRKVSVQQVDARQVQQALRLDPLADGSEPEILIDNDSPSGVSLSGGWHRLANAPGCYGSSLLVDSANTGGMSSVRFTPDVRKPGDYQVYMYVPKLANHSARLSVNLFDGTSENEVILNVGELRVEGQTSGEWMLLGKVKLQKGTGSYVAVTTKSATGRVVADAVLFIAR